MIIITMTTMMLLICQTTIAHRQSLVNLDNIHNRNLAWKRKHDTDTLPSTPSLPGTRTELKCLSDAVGEDGDDDGDEVDDKDGVSEETSHSVDAKTRTELKFLGDALGAEDGDGYKDGVSKGEEEQRTSLGNAVGVAEEVGVDGDKDVVSEETSHPVDATTNGPRPATNDAHDTTTTGSNSNTRRASYVYLTPAEKDQQRTCSHTIPQDFLDSHETASSCIGTKISCLLSEIRTMTEGSRWSKCVVFSQYPAVLDVAAEELRRAGIRFVRVEGSRKGYQRDHRADAVLDFSADPGVRVLMLSMRAGAAGLNLIAADHCFIMDAVINSVVEERAINCMYRIGQTRPVTVKRFIIKDSIEERILSTRRCGPSTDRPQDLPRIDGADTIADERSLPEHYDDIDINDIDDDDNDDSERQPQQSPSKRARRTLDLQGQLEALFGYSTTAVARAGKS